MRTTLSAFYFAKGVKGLISRLTFFVTAALLIASGCANACNEDLFTPRYALEELDSLDPWATEQIASVTQSKPIPANEAIFYRGMAVTKEELELIIDRGIEPTDSQHGTTYLTDKFSSGVKWANVAEDIRSLKNFFDFSVGDESSSVKSPTSENLVIVVLAIRMDANALASSAEGYSTTEAIDPSRIIGYFLEVPKAKEEHPPFVFLSTNPNLRERE